LLDHYQTKEEAYNCDTCRDTGFITYVKYLQLKPGFPYSYASRCSCDAGYKLSARIPFYHALVGHERVQEYYSPDREEDEPEIMKK